MSDAPPPPPPPRPPSGWPPPGQYPYPPPVAGPPRYSAKAIGAFVAALAGLIVAPMPLGIVAVAVGATSRTQLLRAPGRERGANLALAAIIIGVVDVVLAIVIDAVFID